MKNGGRTLILRSRVALQHLLLPVPLSAPISDPVPGRPAGSPSAGLVPRGFRAVSHRDHIHIVSFSPTRLAHNCNLGFSSPAVSSKPRQKARPCLSAHAFLETA